MALTPERKTQVRQDIRNLATILLKFTCNEVEIKVTAPQLAALQEGLVEYKTELDPTKFIYEGVEFKFSLGGGPAKPK